MTLNYVNIRLIYAISGKSDIKAFFNAVSRKSGNYIDFNSLLAFL